jgi:hypothetical protein
VEVTAAELPGEALPGRRRSDMSTDGASVVSLPNGQERGVRQWRGEPRRASSGLSAAAATQAMAGIPEGMHHHSTEGGRGEDAVVWRSLSSNLSYAAGSRPVGGIRALASDPVPRTGSPYHG